MVAVNEYTDEPKLVRRYCDGAGWGTAKFENERAFRQGFVEEARRVVREWIDPDYETHDPFGELKSAHQLRLRLRERYSVYGPGCEGRRTYHLGYRPRHEAPAARLRGRHHALAYVTQTWDETDDFDTLDRLILPAWLTAVEQWAAEPVRPRIINPPPRPLEIEGAVRCLADAGKTDELETSADEPSSHGLQLTRADQIEIRPPDWLLRGILECDTLALIFGDPGSGKSFLAIDWACRIATGTPWRGHGVRGGPVVYVAGEGQQGLGRRLRAWQECNGVSLTGVNLYVAPAVAIPDPGRLAELTAAIEGQAEPPALIVLDTLARCFGGGDENSTQDMSRFVSACDAMRRQWGCTILVVHHTGHADKNRARGAIALKAALDAEYRLAKDGSLLLTATKMKDAEIPPPLAMELATVDVPGIVDDYGNPVTSAAIELLDADTGAIVSKAKTIRPRGKWQDVGFAIARRLIAASDDGRVSIDTWRDECKAVGMIRQNQHRVLDALANRDEIIVTDGQLSLSAP
jgi:hypothetical protein